jgi:TPR repeat protein
MNIRPLLTLALSCAFTALPAGGQTAGTPLPGLKEKEKSTSPSPVPQASPAAPDIPAIRKKAGAGDAESQLQLAALILSGGVKDAKPAEAAKLLEKAAESGHAAAQFHFARLLQSNAPGTKADPDRARFLFQQSAEAGFAPAQAAWGQILESQIDPKGRDVSYEEPAKWYEKAAAQGDAEGICRLGMLKASGRLKSDPAEAWKLLQKAAQAGHAVALNECGVALQRGQGVEKDDIAAVGYFHAAADLGNTTALHNLGRCYREGIGIPRNPEKAGAAFAAAAKVNFGPSQFILAEIFEKGEGTAANPVSAAVNYEFAARNGIPAGHERYEALRKRLTPAQTKEVDKLLKEAVPPR